MKPRSKKNLIIGTIVMILIAGTAGGYYWKNEQDKAAAAAEPVLQTTKVRAGDIVLSASGPGTIVPAEQAEIGFRSGGIVEQVFVSAGDSVERGQPLAALNSAFQESQYYQAKAEFEGLFSAEGIAKAKITLANAQIVEADAIDNLRYLISPEVYTREVALATVEAALLSLENDANVSDSDKTAARDAVAKAQKDLENARYRYKTIYVPGTFEVTYIDEETLEEITTIIAPTDSEIALARATLESARFSVIDATSYLDVLLAGIDAITGPIPTIPGTETAKIEQARIDYEDAKLTFENTTLGAPFAGEILSVDALPGQTVTTNPFITIANTNLLSVHFYLDESDIDKAMVGNRVVVIFAAYPDLSFEGVITAVDRVLQNLDGTPAVSLWAELQPITDRPILSGMSVDVEVIGGESLGTVLVPAEAVREIAENTYAVFTVQPDGSLKLTPIVVGLRDFANVEVLSGLRVGDVISTGTLETK